ncbi:ferritin-like domain-containing protein [Pedomonas mirosovicensis]|uniref:ferritin-like domain-containing protein n=1 Tax=Pedomonas mirosovicensis TaxID=2908641 RepID=UPI0021677095|nr:ferritin-like domain-containing protein [Pedomonas mirosovicensis]MCH8684579.1 ferritin-like domain-containing protein [Pedomonas mirosovicensis]
MARWTLNDIPWDRFDPSKVEPDLLAVIKTAALVEANAADYVVYLRNVFREDADFVAAAETWGVEEEQHGAALGRWAELADPGFSFEKALADFRAGYSLDLETTTSIRGSRAGELIARQVVETGTSSFYSAIRDATDEPVLKAVAGRIASDEFFHYRLFAEHFRRYQAKTRLSTWARLKIAFGRMQEAEDEELGYAFFAANVLQRDRAADFKAVNYGREYQRRALQLYRRPHIDNAVRMVLRAADLKSNGWLYKLASRVLWRVISAKSASMARAA